MKIVDNAFSIEVEFSCIRFDGPINNKSKSVVRQKVKILNKFKIT